MGVGILRRMLTLRVDPWAPDRGMGFEASADETPATADPNVETADWSAPRIVPEVAEQGLLYFVDGVRRIELRLVVDDGEHRGFGLFGSSAAGAVRCDGRASFGEHEVGRTIVVGSGLRPDPVEIRVGTTRLVYAPRSEPGTDTNAPLDGLQKEMQRAEANLASRLAAQGDCLVLADGRLGFLDPTASPIVGLVKRFVRAYLEARAGRVAPAPRGRGTHPAVRSDLRGAAARALRLVHAPRAASPSVARPRGARALRGARAIGLDDAVAIADRVTALLPGFGGRASDPRTPQNLAPVAALEGWLQHRMGNRAIVSRALTQALIEEELSA